MEYCIGGSTKKMECRRNRFIQYILVAVLIPVAYLLMRLTGINGKGMEYFRTAVLCIMTIGMIVLIKYFIRMDKGKNFEQEHVIALILLMGLIMRITYMLYTPCDIRSHDLWDIETDAYGHAAYILNIMKEGHLPQSNLVQFYQQPLFYLLGTAVSGGINGILGTWDNYSLVDATKTLSCIASCVSLLAGREILEECGLSGKGLYRALIILAFLPVYFMTGGRVGPDALAGMFMILALLYTIRWIKCQNWKNTIILAFIYGLGMMTKISCAVMAFLTALVFAVYLIRAIKKRTWKDLLIKYAVFGVISLPIGLWYSVRNYMLFAQPLNYVLRIPKDNALYTGNISIPQRLLVVKMSNLLADPYTDVREDYNLPVYALKSALFGEFRYENWGWVPVLLLLFSFLLAVLCVIAVISCIRDQRKDRWCMFMLLAGGIFYGSIVVFYLQYPFGCSMDFRYMLFLPVPMTYLFGKCKLFLKGNWGRYSDICCLLFAIASCLMFC